jgi:hypothetical protein
MCVWCVCVSVCVWCVCVCACMCVCECMCVCVCVCMCVQMHMCTMYVLKYQVYRLSRMSGAVTALPHTFPRCVAELDSVRFVPIYNHDSLIPAGTLHCSCPHESEF